MHIHILQIVTGADQEFHAYFLKRSFWNLTLKLLWQFHWWFPFFTTHVDPELWCCCKEMIILQVESYHLDHLIPLFLLASGIYQYLKNWGKMLLLLTWMLYFFSEGFLSNIWGTVNRILCSLIEKWECQNLT